MDTQIWYSIFSTIYGGFAGAFDRLGEVIISIIFVFLALMVIFCVHLKWGIWMHLHKPYTVTNLHISFEMRHLDAFLASMLHILVR